MNIEITNRKGETFTVLFDDEDYELIKNHKWLIHKNRNTSYSETWIKNKGKPKLIGMHRLLLNTDNTKLVVDHINGNGLDNRRCNIRTCTQAQNLLNRGSFGGSSIYCGVSYDKFNKKWYASISINRKLKNLGRFNNEIDAAKKYDQEAIIHHKEFAKLNFQIV